MTKFTDFFFACIKLQCCKNKKAANNGIDFVKYLDKDVVYIIFSYLDDVDDIRRASCVSRLWKHYVLNNANDLYYNLCLRKAPGISSVSSMLECVNDQGTITSKFIEVKDKYKVYSSLLRPLSISTKHPRDCLQAVVGSSSTHRHPELSIVHILKPEPRFMSYDSYWSSRGVSDSTSNESILLMLYNSVTVITEIDIHPYKAFREPGNPIYSPRFVRFKMGHPRLKVHEYVDSKDLPLLELDDNKYIWTYTSPEFPVLQDDSLQRFKLQEPVICLGGFLKIELLGRAQRNEQDGKYYTCINHVKVLGHSLSPAFEVAVNPTQTEICSSGDLQLTFYPKDVNGVLLRIYQHQDERQNVADSVAASQFRSLVEMLLDLEFLLDEDELGEDLDLENIPMEDLVDFPWN